MALPEVTARAKEQLAGLPWYLKAMTGIWLRRLARGQVSAEECRVLDVVPRDPPWQRGDFTPNVIVIFRALGKEEREGPDAPRLLIARIVDPAGFDAAIAELLVEAREQEEKEQEQEEQEQREEEEEGGE